MSAARRKHAEKRERTWQWPWEYVPGDDGYRWSMRFAQFGCGILLLLPVLFAGMAAAIILVVGEPHEEPLATAVLVVGSLAILPAAPFVREKVARVGISAHLEGRSSHREPRAVYAGFAVAAITGFLVAQVSALFGFVATALTRDPMPLLVGAGATYGVWAMMWPRRVLWDRWTWQAKLRREQQPRG